MKAKHRPCVPAPIRVTDDLVFSGTLIAKALAIKL